MASNVAPSPSVSSSCIGDLSHKAPEIAPPSLVSSAQTLPPALSLFSSVTILNIADHASIKLARSRTFPGGRYTLEPTSRPVPEDWNIVPLTSPTSSIALELCERLGIGRTGITYSARVVDVSSDVDEAVREQLPSHVCLKISMPYHCRSQAREAWIYEQLEESKGLQGVIVPRCFGFFEARLSDVRDDNGNHVHNIRPWEEANIDIHLAAPEDNPPDLHPSCDVLAEDYRDFADDPKQSMTSSRWYKWRPVVEDPLITILITELLGERYSLQVHDSPDGHDRQDIEDILDDLAIGQILHLDLRWNNVLHIRDDSTIRICPRHNRPHKWRLIDFDQSMKTDQEELDNEDDDTVRLMNWLGFSGSSVFWGRGPYDWDDW